jgi:PTS system mannose-specific IIB component
MIVLARIDDRLIHGQVTVGWSRFLGAEKLVVISDEFANDEMQRSFLEMAVPETAAFDLGSVAEIAERLKNPAYLARPTILLAASPREYRRLILDHGAAIAEVNLGGQRTIEGTRKVCDGILLTEEAWQDLVALHDAGVFIDLRMIPSNEKVDLFAVFDGGGIA